MKITVTMELTQENLSKLRALLPDTEIPGQVSMFDSPSEKPVEPTAEAPKTEAPAPATEAPTYMVKVGDFYKIQVGAFKVKANAEATLKKLQAAGFSAFITTEQGAGKSVDELAREVLQGKWGNGAERKKRLEAAGYDYAAVQKKVNQLA